MSRQQSQTPDDNQIPRKGLKAKKPKYEWELWSKRIKGSKWDYLFFKKGEEPQWHRQSKYKTERGVDQAIEALKKNKWWKDSYIYEKRKVT